MIFASLKWLSMMLLTLSCCALALPNTNNSDNQKFAAVVHMANNAATIDWAIRQGANGIELDLNFASDGRIKEFRHGDICDCSIKCPLVNMCDSTSICRVLWNFTGSNCNATEYPSNLIKAMARNKHALAVVYVDSKLSNIDTVLGQELAGKYTIQLFDQAFTEGYLGQVIISAPKIANKNYLISAINAANASPYKDNYFFTIDEEEPNFSNTMQALISLTPNRIYSIGISALAPLRFYTTIQLATINFKNSSLGGVGIWTIDDPTSMNDYIKLGANIIITNELPRLLSTLSTNGKLLAKPGELLRRSTSNTISGYDRSRCNNNNDCMSRACGRISAADNAPLVCCAYNVNYWGYDYCGGMPDGSICWADTMCATGYCRNNAGGLKKGICGR
jgi:hypothetical protein